MADPRVFDAPNWLILGVPLSAPNMVAGQSMTHMVLASKDMDQANLESFAQRVQNPFDMSWSNQFGDPVYTLTARTKSITVAYGTDYQSALTNLMNIWNPEPDDEPLAEIEPIRPELNAGSENPI